VPRASQGALISGLTVAHAGPELKRMTWTVVELTQHLLVRYVLDSPPIEREDFLADAAHIVLTFAYGTDAPERSDAGARRATSSR
jgi:hypothetical protein